MASRVLDEFIIQEVARSCPEPFLNYHKCIDDPSIQDKSQCSKYQTELQKCIKTKVTVYHDIEKNCAKTISSFQDCLTKDTEGNASSKCYNQLKELRDCAMNVIDKSQKNQS